MIKIYNPTKRPVKASLKKIIKKYKHDLNLVISHGGDGSLLGASRQYPNLEILPIRSSKICHHCYSAENVENILKSIKSGTLKPKKHIKLIAVFKNHKIIALNEINIKCSHPNLALRFSYSIGDTNYTNNIADGIIISTPFGSTAYFKSITNMVFSQGIGVAVNNSIKQIANQIVDDSSLITINIDRENACLCADNYPKIFKLKPGDKIVVKKSIQSAYIY